MTTVTPQGRWEGGQAKSEFGITRGATRINDEVYIYINIEAYMS